MVNSLLTMCEACFKSGFVFVGVKPSDGDWSTQNALFFKTYVDDKVFASYVMEVKPDKILCLQLIDISGKDDLAVSTYLVENYHATAA